MSGPMSLEPGGAEQDTLALRLADDRTLALRLADAHPGAPVLPRRRAQADAVDGLAAALADGVAPHGSTPTRSPPCWSPRASPAT